MTSVAGGCRGDVVTRRTRMRGERHSHYSIAHTRALFKTVCWLAGRVSSPAHVENHEPRNGARRRGFGGGAARAFPGFAVARARRPAPGPRDAASADSPPR